MSETLDEKRKVLRRMELEVNIARLETRLLELDEEKIKLQENIDVQQDRLTKGDY